MTGRKAAVRLEAIVLDTDDPERLATFYARLLDWEIVRRGEDDTWLTLRGDVGVDLCCQLVVSYRPPTWPSPDLPQQYHLDLVVDDVEAAGALAVELGAQRVRGPDQHAYAVYVDPSGHPFCLTR